MAKPVAVAVFCATVATALFGQSTIRGDANGDGATNALDVFAIANSIYSGVPLDSPCRADADSNGAIDVGDADYLTRYLFTAGPAPLQPTYFRDADNDGFGNAAMTFSGCGPAGYVANSLDCNDSDPSIHPGAADDPDMAFTDSNCDGYDGDLTKAIFVSTTGNDTADGLTPATAVHTIAQAMVNAAANPGRTQILIATGGYDEGAGVTARSGVGIYGGYSTDFAQRSNANTVTIAGAPQALYANSATAVTVQLVTLAGQVDAVEPSVYGVRAVNGSALTLDNVTVTAASGRAGTDGPNGFSGSDAGPGGNAAGTNPGNGGSSPSGATGGAGGVGPVCTAAGNSGSNGAAGGGTGGAGGFSGTCTTTSSSNGGDAPLNAQPGQLGAVGPSGSAGTFTLTAAGVTWNPGLLGTAGGNGLPGGGGGGGGSGGGTAHGTTIFCTDCSCVAAGAGGGGGGGGGGGAGGQPGTFGGGSFGIYLLNSQVTAIAGSVTAGNGGRGGNGGSGGAGGHGGGSGVGAFGSSDTSICGTRTGGNGAPGAPGGNGGAGGPGGCSAGGPSIAVYRRGASTFSSTGTTLAAAAPGAGGSWAGAPCPNGVSAILP